MQVESNISAASMFVEVENNLTWRVVYHRETKVMYVISQGTENHGNFTVMLNPDGTPQTWKGILMLMKKIFLKTRAFNCSTGSRNSY